MYRLAFAAIVAAVACIPSSALARKIAYRPEPAPTATRAATSDMVAIGRVTAIEQAEAEVAESAGATEKAAYRLAVLQIEEPLTDTGGQTHVRIGYDPVGAAPRYDRFRFDFRMAEGAAGVFFLTKHPSGSFYVFTRNSPPLEPGDKAFREDVELVRRTTGVLADPVKALKAADAKDRYFAAAVLVQKYRTPPMGSPGEAVAVPADESKLILQAIADADWAGEWKAVPAPYQTFVTLGLTAADKWTPAPLNDNGDLPAHTKEEFGKWLEGNGAKYQVKKYAAK